MKLDAGHNSVRLFRMRAKMMGREVLDLLRAILLETVDLRSEDPFKEQYETLVHTHWAFLNDHLKHLGILGKQVFEAHDRSAFIIARVGARSMMESYFQIAAVKERPIFAAEKIICDAEEMLKRALIPKDHQAYQGALKGIQEFRGKHNIHAPLKFTVLDIARIGGLEPDYRNDYMLLSMHSHVAIPVLFGLGQDGDKNIIIQTALRTILASLAYAIDFLPTKTPDIHLQKIASLMRELLSLMDEGHFQNRSSLP